MHRWSIVAYLLNQHWCIDVRCLLIDSALMHCWSLLTYWFNIYVLMIVADLQIQHWCIDVCCFLIYFTLIYCWLLFTSWFNIDTWWSLLIYWFNINTLMIVDWVLFQHWYYYRSFYICVILINFVIADLILNKHWDINTYVWIIFIRYWFSIDALVIVA